MRIKWILAAILVLAVIGIVIGPSIDRAVNDTMPSWVDLAETITVDVPAPMLPLARESDSPPPPAQQIPLTKNLVTIAFADVRVPEGVVRLTPGLKVELINERGVEVDVKLGRNILAIPRLAVAVEPEPDVFMPQPKLAMPAPLEKVLFAPPPSIALSAHEIGTGKGVERNWSTDYGSSDRDFYRTKGIQVELRNISRRESGNCSVAVYWMARTLSDRQMHVHHGETLPANVIAMSSKTLRFWCPLLPANVANYVALGERSVEGSKIDGWFVLVSRNGHTLSGYSPSPTYQKLLRDPQELQTLLAAYTPSGRRATGEMPHWRHDPVRDEWRARHSTGY